MDGHLRQVIVDVIGLAERYGRKAIVVENLGFEDMRASGREKQASTPWFRKIVCGIPTAKFRDHLIPMIARHSIVVVGVPAAYSSIWGKQYWQSPISTKHHKVSGHSAAAVVLARRAFGYRARRRVQTSPGVTTSEQSIKEAGFPADVESCQAQHAYKHEAEREELHKPPRREGFCCSDSIRPKTANVGSRGSRLVKTVRTSRVPLDGT